MTITGDFERFQYSTSKQVFIKWKISFEKLEFFFLVERTTIENATFPCKTALPKTSFKTTRMGSANYWMYHKGRSFATNYFIFLKIQFQYKDLFRKVDSIYHSYFLEALEFIGGCVFPVSILKRKIKRPARMYTEASTG